MPDYLIDAALARKLAPAVKPPAANRLPLTGQVAAVSTLSVSANGCILTEPRDPLMTIDQQVWSLLRRFHMDPRRFHGWKLEQGSPGTVSVRMA
jgi:hypothetical protein